MHHWTRMQPAKCTNLASFSSQTQQNSAHSGGRPIPASQHAAVQSKALQPAQDHSSTQQWAFTRRNAMHAAALWLAQASLGTLPASALTPPPFLQGLWGALGPISPEPIRFPRKNLDLRFAVLLMRSSYDVVDDLDFVPMDQFQIDFWKLRRAEYEPYMLQYSPLTIKAGDLTDPLYFDFISFAQYATIAKEIPQGKSEFMERCEECEGDERRLIVRDAKANGTLEQLPSNFKTRVADRIYTSLRDGFRGETFWGPPAAPPGAPLADVAYGVQRIMDIFVDKGYALKADVVDIKPAALGSGGTFTVRIEGPANLWGIAALASRRSLAINAYDALAIEGYLRASKREADYTLSRTDTAVETAWKVY